MVKGFKCIILVTHGSIGVDSVLVEIINYIFIPEEFAESKKLSKIKYVSETAKPLVHQFSPHSWCENIYIK